MTQKYTVPSPGSLFQFLCFVLPDSSKTTIRSWLKEGRVSINGECVKMGAFLLQGGEEVCLEKKQQILDSKLRIVYEDKHLVVIDKPSGLLSVATAFEKGETVHALLKKRYPGQKIYVIHRLDQDTSGVMMFALSEPAFIKLKDLFKKHQIQRTYSAIVEGRMETPQGTWQSYLWEDDIYYVHSSQNPSEGQLSLTHYQVKSISKDCTLLELTLETGRKNQIRVHCAEAGHPVVGDMKYGATKNSLKRLCLHAAVLGFQHPIFLKDMKFESPLPDTFNKIFMNCHA